MIIPCESKSWNLKLVNFWKTQYKIAFGIEEIV